MHVHLADPETAGWLFFIFGIYKFICHRLVPVSMNILASKTEALQMSPQDKIIFLKTVPMILIKLSCIGDIIRKLMAHALRAKMQNVDFVETCYWSFHLSSLFSIL
jgi:hypothetical protein